MPWAIALGTCARILGYRFYGVMAKQEFRRLPSSVVPDHYKVFLNPSLTKLELDGNLVVEVQVKEANVNEIILHCLDLKVTNVSISETSGVTQVNDAALKLSAEQETLTIPLEKSLAVGSAKISLNFSGKITDVLKGLYNSKYTTPSGEERNSVVTQFEATDARRCFPCWDEPALKATFDISVRAPKNLVCLSNMPEKSVEIIDEDKIVHFDKTPRMSTYLVALAVGEYDFVEDTTTDGLRVRVYTPVGKAEQGRFALEVATKVMPYYNNYFNIAYPLPKLDLIAVSNLAAGAMENWGLVTYRETCLLVDHANTSATNRQYVALVVGHELAHQWFGNLVTMEWWTHLWLNEGYASFVEYLCVDHLFPDFQIWTQCVTDMFCVALELDALRNSHPIEVPVGHPSEIDEIFDDISYNKGASVIRMLHRYIGDQDFRKGMNLYLTRHAYNNTQTEDLWAALEQASGKPVGAVMSTWTKQRGYPVLKVALDNNKLSVRQQRFSADGASSEPTQWMVPVTVATQASGGEEVLSVMLDGESAEYQLPAVADGWVKLNPGSVGFYRTQYPPVMLERFYPAIKDKTLPPLDRLGLLDDLFALMIAGESSTLDILRLMDAYRLEDNYTVWSSINSCVAKLNILLSHTHLLPLWRKHLSRLFIDIFNKLGWTPKPNESHLNTMLRALVLGRLAWCGESSVLEEARRKFDAHVAGTELIPADLRGAVYRAIGTHGGVEAFEALLKLYRSVELREEKDRIARTLGCSRDPTLLTRALEFAMSDEVRSQDSVNVLTPVACFSAEGRDLAWAFFQKHHKLLVDRYRGGFILTRIVKYTTENFASEEKAVEIENFFRENPCPGTERTVQQSVETIRLNAAWLKRDLPAVEKFLNNQSE